MGKELRKLSRLEILEVMLALRDDYDLLQRKMVDKNIEINGLKAQIDRLGDGSDSLRVRELEAEVASLRAENKRYEEALRMVGDKVGVLQKNYGVKLAELKRQVADSRSLVNDDFIRRIEELEAELESSSEAFAKREVAYSARIGELELAVKDGVLRENALRDEIVRLNGSLKDSEALLASARGEAERIIAEAEAYREKAVIDTDKKLVSLALAVLRNREKYEKLLSDYEG